MELLYEWAPAVVGVFVAALAWRVPRAPVWIALLLTSFVLSALWWDFGGDYPAMFGGATNFIIALIMLRFARNKWEFYVLNCYGFMILIDIMWQFGTVPSHYWYAVSLEAANWAILLIVGTMGTLERRSRHARLHSRYSYAGPVDLAHHYLVEKTRYPRWWRVWR